jgi:hypothetical protein
MTVIGCTRPSNTGTTAKELRTRLPVSDRGLWTLNHERTEGACMGPIVDPDSGSSVELRWRCEGYRPDHRTKDRWEPHATLICQAI